MEDKILTGVICVHCGGHIKFYKRKEQQQCLITCPGCKRKLHIIFNVNVEPQFYSFLPYFPKPDGKKTADGSDIGDADNSTLKRDDLPDEETGGKSGRQEEPRNDSPEEKASRKPKHATVHKKTHGEAKSYDYVPGEDPEEGEETSPKKKKSNYLREPLILTRKKLFGLKGEQYRIVSCKTVIGRPDTYEPSDLNIPGDDTISRRSVVLEVNSDSYGSDYILKVLNASNPVFVNGKKLAEGDKKNLYFGDVITLGHTNLIFGKED